jgi:dipeptidyl aminopeptidase/acylaminoacyl peptidase
MTKTLLTAAAALLVLAPVTTAAQEAVSPGPAVEAAAPPPAPMTAEQMIRLNRLAAPTVSPDGRWVVYQLTETAGQNFERTTGLFLLDTRAADAEAQAIADLPGANESGAAFSADGRRLYFISNKSGSDQLWYVDLTTGPAGMAVGTPVQASETVAEVAGFRLSPDGQRVLLSGTVQLGCPQFGCRSNGVQSQTQPGPGSARVYDQIFVRHWNQWETPGTYNRTYSFALDANGRVTGQGVDVAGALVGDTPTQPYGGSEEIAFSQDSASVFFTLRIADRMEPTSTNTDIYQVPAAGGSATNLTDANDATDALPSPSPDGRWLAYVAMARPSYEADRQVLMLRDLRQGTTRALTQDWDRSVASISWAPDSRSLVVTVPDTLEHPAYRVDVRTGRATRLIQAGNVGDVTALPDGSILYALNSITAPNDLYLRRANGAVQRLTNVNGDVLAPSVVYRQYSFVGANGDRVWGQILTPQGANGRLPTVLIVHGGPQGSFGNSWSYRWSPALWAAQGYAVVTVDFHGSTGYGQAFTDSINRNWGGWPLEDLRLGFAAAAAQSPHVDTANACAAGASYGGYMINWMAGNWPDGFRCLINHAGIFDLRAMAFETEELWFDEWDHGGPWWSRDPEARERWNPVNHVARWRTPTLVIHGERDFRIPYTQGIAAFTAMQRQGIDSRLVMFPDEGHWINRPQNSLQWHNEVFGWLARHLRGGAAAAP